MRFPRLGLIFAFLFMTNPGLLATSGAATLPDFVELAETLKPAVVNIGTAKTVRPRRPMMPIPRGPGKDLFEDFFERFFKGEPFQPQRERSLGSGFIISEDGFILTNDHVVKGADEVTVKLSDGRSFPAAVKGLDPKLDLALLKIEVGADLPAVKLGDSDALRVGEWLMAIGNPFGLEQTVTVGIVSAKGRVIGAGPYDDFIQTDASINPGNSGGPLFNTRGEVIGINTAIVAGGQGIGFAIPINAAREVLPQLRETGRVVRGWLGVSVQQVSAELAESFRLPERQGALVAEVLEDSPAAEAGLRQGDIILAFAGKEVREMNDLPRVVAATPIGKEVAIEVFRDGEKKTLKVKVGRQETAEGAAPTPSTADRTGLTVTDITPEVMEKFQLESDRGALISAIDPEGPAADANLRVGDLVLEVNGRAVGSAAEFREVLEGVREGAVVRLLVRRQASAFYTTLKVR